MNICICGGGSLGHVCAGVLGSRKDVSVNILSGHPERWRNDVTVKDADGKTYVARINAVSNNPEQVVADQDIILLCLPGFLIEKTLNAIKPLIGNAVVGSIVSSTGFFFFAHRLLGNRAKLFGFQRVPYIARVDEYGKTAKLLGYKSSLAVAVENIVDAESFRFKLEGLFATPTVLLDSYYEAALTNSNPILHTGRLYSMFQGFEDSFFDHNILFYKEWTDAASEILIDMDAEFFRLLDALDVHGIQPLLVYYECSDAMSLTRKIASIPAFRSIKSPMIETANGWKVDFNSRYFTEDFPYGLRWIRDLSVEHGIETPVIEKVYHWGMSRLDRL